MKPAAQEEFALAPGLIQLNHASYGLTSRRVMTEAERIRAHIESDPTRHLGAELTERLRAQTSLVATTFALEPDRTTLCTNATSGAAAIIESLPLADGDTVVVLDTEYSSIQRGWELACAKTGVRLVIVPVSLPFHGPQQLLDELTARVPGSVTYLQMSLISSSAAIGLPVADIAQWVKHRGGQLIIDAAHGPGHIPMAPTQWGVTAMFGTLHKWLPTLRPVGFLWLATELTDQVRPAEVSLTWDCPDLIERFSWPGTFDPVPRLCLDTAIAQWNQWHDGDQFSYCETVADIASDAITGLGGRPTATTEYLPPRMRSFILDGVSVAEVKAALHPADVRTWVGPGPAGECLLRISTHVYNDQRDIETLTARIQEVLPR
ncbi:aminotransferase class V-fold PLP-dependent enzyme [Nocardia pseudovaccinii]|uniref:aminotransferase class V-fold PLP-dependent enzyme n=1 Tax=Nocardia pseudovaccinii TaxID=189540 RepID=UPI003D9457BD